MRAKLFKFIKKNFLFCVVFYSLICISPLLLASETLKGDLLSVLDMSVRVGEKVADSGNILTLDQCLEKTIARSGKLHIAKEEYKLAIQEFKKSRRDLFPKAGIKYEEMDGTTTGEDFRAEGYKFEVQYPLYTSGRVSKQYKQARLNLTVARIKHDQVLAEVLNEAEKAYYIWIEAKSRLNAVSQLTDIARDVEDMVRKRHEAELARDLDLKETEILVRKVTQKVSRAENDLVLAEISLRQLIEEFDMSLLSIESLDGYSELDWNAEDLLEIALNHRPDIILSRLQEEINRYNKDIARAENGLQINFDAYMGERGENFVSEDLVTDDEYYIGLSAKMPIGGNTIEAEVIDQDTVPSAGQTTSTQFTSYSIKLNLLDNPYKTGQLEGMIKYYKAIEDFEKNKKSAVFEVGKNLIETEDKYKTLLIASDEKSLEEEKLKLSKIRLGKNEIATQEYLKSAIAFIDTHVALGKAVSAYYAAVSDLNKSLGKPGYFNPVSGQGDENTFSKFYPKAGAGDSRFWQKKFDPYLPSQPFEALKFRKQSKNFLLFKKSSYQDLETYYNREVKLGDAHHE